MGRDPVDRRGDRNREFMKNVEVRGPFVRLQYLVFVGLFALSVGLAGCSAGANASRMTIGPADLVKAPNGPMQQAVAVGEVAGGSETNPLWMSRVSTAAFRAALTDSLRMAGLLASGDGRYKLKATLLSLDQPMVGFDMTVTAIVQYFMTDAATGAMVWQDTITTPFTATVGDAFLGNTRLQKANEGAVKANLLELIQRLNAASVRSPVSLN